MMACLENWESVAAPATVGSAPQGKKLPVVVAAIAREMAAFLWAIGQVAPA